jgi:hypothetical protein
MRYFYCFVFIVPICLYSQTSNDVTEKFKKYEFILECPIYKCDIEGKIIDTSKMIAEIGSRFIVVYEEKDNCIIRFLLNTKRNKKAILDFKGKEIENYKYYTIKKAQLDFKAISANFNNYSLAVGSTITPLKLRFKPFTFSKDFTIGPTIGIRYTPHEYSKISYSTLIGVGISSITLDSFNTNGFLSNNLETIAFTPSIGGMLEYGNSQVGVFIGLDLLNSSNDASNHFIYKGSPWISIGFGYAIFSNKQQ